jgi:hypothetical protein
MRNAALQEVQAQFDDVMRRYGPRVDTLAIPLPISLGIDQLRALFQYCTLTQIRAYGENGLMYFDFLNNADFNAVAAADDTNDYVGLFTGLFSRFFRLAYCFMSDRDVLPTFGESNGESLSPLALAAIRDDDLTFKISQYPRDTKRCAAAQSIAMAACLLVLNHELGHVANCHVQFLRRQFGINTYEEISMAGDEAQAQLHRAFEWAADEYASVVTYLFLNHAQVGFSTIEELGVDYIQSVATIHAFLYIYKLSRSRFDIESLTHPAPIDRWLWVTYCIESNDQTRVLNPRHVEIVRGIRDVWDFWCRHELVERRPADLSRVLERSQARHDKASTSLEAVNRELASLIRDRHKRGTRWREAHEAEILYFAKKSLDQVATKGPDPREL